jgi:YcxB-like protein
LIVYVGSAAARATDGKDAKLSIAVRLPRVRILGQTKNMIVVSFIYTEEVFLDAHRELFRAVTPWWRRPHFFALISFSCLAVICLLNPCLLGEGFTPKLLYPLLFGLLFLSLPLLIRSKARRQFRSSPYAGLQFTWRIDSARLSFETQGSTAVFEWNKLVRVEEVKEGFLLFSQPKLANWLPKSGFASSTDLDDFREYVRESGVKADR